MTDFSSFQWLSPVVYLIIVCKTFNGIRWNGSATQPANDDSNLNMNVDHNAVFYETWFLWQDQNCGISSNKLNERITTLSTSVESLAHKYVFTSETVTSNDGSQFYSYSSQRNREISVTFVRRDKYADAFSFHSHSSGALEVNIYILQLHHRSNQSPAPLNLPLLPRRGPRNVSTNMSKTSTVNIVIRRIVRSYMAKGSPFEHSMVCDPFYLQLCAVRRIRRIMLLS